MLIRHGFINEDSGFKVMHNYTIEENKKFNIIASQGGKLCRLIDEMKCPFYIDRLLGGTYYHSYSFSKELLMYYENMLGDLFYGIQIHEAASVLNFDWNRIRKCLSHMPQPWTEQMIYNAIEKISPDKDTLLMSSGTPGDFAQKKYSETWQDYVEEIRDFLNRKNSENYGFLLPCYAGIIFTSFKARSYMAELGAQTPYAGLQLAATRALAKRYAASWGVYYEPWGADVLSAPKFFDEDFNEWNLKLKKFNFDFESYGERGGGSRSLQRRIYFSALLAGADYVSEEWGLANTFYNIDGDLSPYGEIKKEFISFASRYKKITPTIPVAVVLPKEFEVIDITGFISCETDSLYLGRVLCNDSKFTHIKKVLQRLFAPLNPIGGREAAVLTNSRFEACFDIVYENSFLQSDYQCVIDTTPDASLRLSANVLYTDDIDEFEHNLDKILTQILPCRVKGANAMNFLIGTQRAVAIFNNNGVKRTVSNGEEYLSQASVRAELIFKEAVSPELIYSCSQKTDIIKISDSEYEIYLPSGAFEIYKY